MRSAPIQYPALNHDLKEGLGSPANHLDEDTITLKVFFAAPTRVCPIGYHTPTLIVGRNKIVKDCLKILVKSLVAQGAVDYRLWRIPGLFAAQSGWCYPINGLGVGGGGRIELAVTWGSIPWQDGEALVIEPKLPNGWLSAFTHDFNPPAVPPRLLM